MIAIGDIHGCFDECQILVEQLIENHPDRELIFLGDYVDRGPDSKDVLAYLYELEAHRSCVFLRGNHDQFMLDVYDGVGDWGEVWRNNGAMSTLNSYGIMGYSPRAMGQYIPAEHIDFLRRTKIYHETDEFFFVHGGIHPYLTVAQAKIGMTNMGFMWQREHMYAKDRVWEKTVVCGHTIIDDPVIKDNLIAIDTGAYISYIGRGQGHLTAILLPEREVIQVESKRKRLVA